MHVPCRRGAAARGTGPAGGTHAAPQISRRAKHARARRRCAMARHRLAYILAFRLAATLAAAMLAYAALERVRDPGLSLVTLGLTHAAHVVALGFLVYV